MIKTYKEYKELAINKAMEKEKELSFDKIDDRYYYIYRISNKVNNKHYYGSRVSNLHPIEDLCITYFSSSRNKNFIQDQKENPQNYKYKVIKIFDNNVDKVLYESYLHQYFNVKSNTNFYNKVNQTPFGRDTTGMVTCIDKDGYVHFLSKEEFDGRDDLNFHTKEMVTCKDINGNTFQVSKEEFDKRDDLFGITIGLFVSVDKDGNKYHISKNDPRYLSGELIAESKGRITSKETKLKLSNIHNNRIKNNLLAEQQRKDREFNTKINKKSIKIMGIYDNTNELQYLVFGNIQKFCKENNLPITPFYYSLYDNTPIYYKESSNGRTRAIKNGTIKYEGWYVKQLERINYN